MAEPKKAFENALLDADSLEKFVNGSEAETVTTRLNANYPTINNAVSQINQKIADAEVQTEAGITALFENGGLPATPFKSKALMEASALVDGDYAMVTDDGNNSGLYIKEGSGWVRSDYDAYAYADDASQRATAEITDYITDKIDNVDAGELAQATLSDDGTILHGVLSNGDIISPHPPIQGFGLEALRSQLLDTDSLNRIGRYYDRAISRDEEAKNFEVMVVEHASDGMAHNRGGGTFYLGNGRFYTTFAQFTEAGGDQSGARLSARFVDVDFENQTATVTPTIVVHDGRADGEGPVAPPSFFRVKDGILMVGNRNREFFCHISKDECQTWTEIYRRTYTNREDSFFVTLSSVTQIPAGPYAGRIVATGFGHSDTPSLQPFTLKSMYSDDEGKTWVEGYNAKGDEIGADFGWSDVMNETGVTVDTDNNLIMVVRDENNGSSTSPNIMHFAKSTDGGQTLKPFKQDSDTFADSCQTSIKNTAPNVWDGVPKIVSVAPHAIRRKGLRLRISYDNARSWAKEYDLFPANVTTGYTSIIQVSPSMLCITTEYGGFNTVSNIALRFINLKEIYNDTTY